MKIFEEPIRIDGYPEMDLLCDLGLKPFCYSYYLIIKKKYSNETDYELSFERLDYLFNWETDWYEGQQDVLLLGYLEGFECWPDACLLKFIDFLKGETVEDQSAGATSI